MSVCSLPNLTLPLLLPACPSLPPPLTLLPSLSYTVYRNATTQATLLVFRSSGSREGEKESIKTQSQSQSASSCAFSFMSDVKYSQEGVWWGGGEGEYLPEVLSMLSTRTGTHIRRQPAAAGIHSFHSQRDSLWRPVKLCDESSSASYTLPSPPPSALPCNVATCHVSVRPAPFLVVPPLVRVFVVFV